MAKKQEFKINFYRDVNGSWAGTAYFINERSNKKYAISAAAAPQDSAKIAKPYIKERLDKMSLDYLMFNPGYSRVNYDEYENFKRQ